MSLPPEEKDFQLHYYGQLIALSIQLYRTPGATALVVVTPTDDEAAYLQFTVVTVTYVCAIYGLDPRHILWVERTPGAVPEADTYALVEFDRCVCLAGGTAQVGLSNPLRAPLPHEQLQQIQSRLREGGDDL